MLRGVKILLVEDDEDDYIIAKEILEEIQGDELDLVWVRDYDRGIAHMAEYGVGVCLVDYRIGARTGLEFLADVRIKGFRCPVILMTGVGMHDIDLAATKAGASDFIDKSELSPSLVERSIRYAIANAKALETLAEQSSLLETTLEHSGAGIAALDNNHNLTTSNKQFDNLLKMVADIHFAHRNDQQAEALKYLVRGLAETRCGELEFKNVAGRMFEIKQNEAPHGGTVIFSVDVTDHKAFEADLIQAKVDAESASRAKSSFLANMTHEFRTPLHGIMGFSDLIMQNSKTDEIKEFVQHISDSSVHLLEIIESVLAFSRLEAGQQPFEDVELLEVDCLVDFCIKQVLPTANQRNIDVVSEVDPRLCSLQCDVISVRRILINLLSNAVRFSTEGGKVEVTLVISPDGQLCLSVRDTGIGMNAEDVDAAFLPFHQLGSGYDRRSEGTGLGLAMVKSLSMQHDAEVAIQTAPQRGTCITVTFPANRVTMDTGPMAMQINS